MPSAQKPFLKMSDEDAFFMVLKIPDRELLYLCPVPNGRRYRQARDLADKPTRRRIRHLPRDLCGVGAEFPKVRRNARTCPVQAVLAFLSVYKHYFSSRTISANKTSKSLEKLTCVLLGNISLLRICVCKCASAIFLDDDSRFVIDCLNDLLPPL